MELARSPLVWFTGYRDTPARTTERFSPDVRWYYTGDTGRQDTQVNTFFSARDDDVIITAGYRIGPFEVESILDGHPDVAESAVVAAPDGQEAGVLGPGRGPDVAQEAWPEPPRPGAAPRGQAATVTRTAAGALATR